MLYNHIIIFLGGTMNTEITKLTPAIDINSLEIFSHAECIFFDIETTRFSPETSYVYLIGCAYYDGCQWVLIQWFAQSHSSESQIIFTFLEFIKNYKTLISYNGNGFDLPYLKSKCTKLGILQSLDTFNHIDLYKAIMPYKKFLRLNNLKQKSIEEFLSIQRNDSINGGELISVYSEYLKTQDNNLLKLLLLHNHDDIQGLLSVFPVISYQYLFQGNFILQDTFINSTDSQDNVHPNEIIFQLRLKIPIPKRISFGYEKFYFTAHKDLAKIKINIYRGELKYFYKNYKDYYYLPQEDTAIHKSVAFYVDKNFRTQSKAANCYSRRTGRFLPQYDEIVSPYFKIDYFDKNTYFELTEEILADTELLKKYIIHILSHMKQ